VGGPKQEAEPRAADALKVVAEARTAGSGPTEIAPLAMGNQARQSGETGSRVPGPRVRVPAVADLAAVRDDPGTVRTVSERIAGPVRVLVTEQRRKRNRPWPRE
jgi:hypothetical protein